MRPCIPSGPTAVCAVWAVLAGCTGQEPRPGSPATPEPTRISSQAALPAPATAAPTAAASGRLPPQTPDPDVEAGIELPEGAGRDTLLSACLGCHDLGGLDLFASFYSRDDWRVLVLTMIETGAAIAPAEVEAIADYLGRHFGTDSP